MPWHALSRDERHRELARRLITAMPIVVALGINFGIVPLLFAQVAYYPVLYPANILIGWFWFAVIPLLMVAYYGVYVYAVQVRGNRVNRAGIGAAAASTLCFVAIGFIFTNNFQLMTRSREMLELFDRTSVAGAVTGLGLNLGDPGIWPRWLMMFGLAVTTASVYVAFDAAVLRRDAEPGYRRWALGRAARLYALGVLWFGTAGLWYLRAAVPAPVRDEALRSPVIAGFGALTVLMSFVVLGWLIRLARTVPEGRGPVVAALALQLMVLTLNAISRQWVQNRELAPFFDPASLRVDPQWGPLALFLVLLAAGVAVIVWMLRRVVRGAPRGAVPRGA